MCEILSRNILEVIDEFDDKQYLMSIIIFNAAPVIAKQKASYLIIFHDKGKRNLCDLWIKYKKDIKEQINIEFYELKNLKDSIVVLFYDQNQIKEILKEKKYIKFLKKFGYNSKMSINQILKVLKERYEVTCPHEIGIFLGYPLEDVVEFIEYPNKKCLMFGYWKVYNNINYAKNTFKIYDECRNRVMKLILQGIHPKNIGLQYFL
ncbi:DUF3793 family protein [Clostridium aestuarii]|uniref:DUF3793 family protein n=1 Tax=Clostridium aestuarii TaxID=338193 RepID=A0ABT4CZR2_9CLOT|nr:DUF3793 family protein [Clostridium aestuarii]MCY6484473.1 DUF3793 family protein [Clostridium aestuarii]